MVKGNYMTEIGVGFVSVCTEGFYLFAVDINDSALLFDSLEAYLHEDYFVTAEEIKVIEIRFFT